MQVIVEKNVQRSGETDQSAKAWSLEVWEFEGFLEVVCRSTTAFRNPPTLQISPQNRSPVTVSLLPKGTAVILWDV